MGRLCFVVGYPRSGTTLLRSLLHGHSQVSVTPEAQFIPLYLRRQSHPWSRFDRDGFVRFLMSHRKFSHWPLDPNDVAQRLARSQAGSPVEAVQLLYEMYGELSGKGYVVDKTPSDLRDLCLLADRFPEARFVHLVRDPLDVVASNLRIQEWGLSDHRELAADWHLAMRRAQRARRTLGPARYLQITYEELTADAPAALSSICRFLDLDFEPDMIEAAPANAEAIAGENSFPQHHGNLSSKVETHRTRVELSPMQKADVLAVLSGRDPLARLAIHRRRAAHGLKVARSVLGSLRARFH